MNYKKHKLGDLDSSEQLIKDLYINLRKDVLKWSKITHQTSQARMGYIGQHLTSVVTGFKGSKSGARGDDLILPGGNSGEIKTCYRVDQLGECKNCKNSVSSIETRCMDCSSQEIVRKDDSKWLIGIRNEEEFEALFDPVYYYFVLFEFKDIKDSKNRDILASIWKVNPKNIGFGYCLLDYYLNIRSKSKSKAPFNMWPHQLKFYLTKPKLIYHSIIYDDDTIKTIVFPTKKNEVDTELPDLASFSRAKILNLENLSSVYEEIVGKPINKNKYPGKRDILAELENIRGEEEIENSHLCDVIARNVYRSSILEKKSKIPLKHKKIFPDLK